MDPNAYGSNQPHYPDSSSGAGYPQYPPQADPSQGYTQSGYPQYPPQADPSQGYGQPGYPPYGAPGDPSQSYGQAGYSQQQAGYPGQGYQPYQQPYPPAGAGYGAPGYAYAPPMMTPKTSGLAIASLVCGIIGLCVGIASVPGIITGHMGVSQIKRSNGMLTGKGLAIAGLILSYLALVVWIFGIILFIIALQNAASASGGTF